VSDAPTFPDHLRRPHCEPSASGIQRACFAALSSPDRSVPALFVRSDDRATARCRFCGVDVTMIGTPQEWARAFGDPVPEPPQPTANELRSIVADGLDGVRVTLAEGRPLKAQEYADALAWDAIDAIAAGCDAPAGLARDLAALRAEVEAAQR